MEFLLFGIHSRDPTSSILENRLCCVLFTETCYISDIQTDTSDFIKQALSYTLFPGMTNVLQLLLDLPVLPINWWTVVVHHLQQTTLFSTLFNHVYFSCLSLLHVLTHGDVNIIHIHEVTGQDHLLFFKIFLLYSMDSLNRETYYFL